MIIEEKTAYAAFRVWYVGKDSDALKCWNELMDEKMKECWYNTAKAVLKAKE